MDKRYVLGVDFGTDSVRALIVDAKNGMSAGEAVAEYPRWKQGLYCNAAIRQFRQHPLDYIEAFTACVRRACAAAGSRIALQIAAISVDTTGSTPCPVNEEGTPLALLPEFAENPDAMFHLWKDHTAVAEAEEITRAFSACQPDYTAYMGPYSSEWFWAKILHTFRKSPKVRRHAAAWVEHCDWMANLLAGTTGPTEQYRCACAAGHKAYWHSSWGGLPSAGCLARLDEYLVRVRESFHSAPKPCTHRVGVITPEWAGRLGLPEDVVISGGSFDAHAGAVGAGVQRGTMVLNIGTSAVNMIVERVDALNGSGFAYLAGQAEDSIIPGYVGIETSQAAYGDTYAWLKRAMLWPVEQVVGSSDCLTEVQKTQLLREAEEKMLPMLQQAAQELPLSQEPLSLDWYNGRRYPHNRDSASSAMTGLTLSTTPPQMYAALVEATAFGQKRIISELIEKGVNIQRIIAVGGIAQKSEYVMQELSDVLQFPIDVSPVAQACAYGAAIYASVAAGFYGSIEDAQRNICNPAAKRTNRMRIVRISTVKSIACTAIWPRRWTPSWHNDISTTASGIPGAVILSGTLVRIFAMCYNGSHRR